MWLIAGVGLEMGNYLPIKLLMLFFEYSLSLFYRTIDVGWKAGVDDQVRVWYLKDGCRIEESNERKWYQRVKCFKNEWICICPRRTQEIDLHVVYSIPEDWGL